MELIPTIRSRGPGWIQWYRAGPRAPGLSNPGSRTPSGNCRVEGRILETKTRVSRPSPGPFSGVILGAIVPSWAHPPPTAWKGEVHRLVPSHLQSWFETRSELKLGGLLTQTHYPPNCVPNLATCLLEGMELLAACWGLLGCCRRPSRTFRLRAGVFWYFRGCVGLLGFSW